MVNFSFVSALSGGLGLLLALYAGLFIALSLTEFCHDAGPLTLSLESFESVIKRFVFFNSYFCHNSLSLPSYGQKGPLNQIIMRTYAGQTAARKTSAILYTIKRRMSSVICRCRKEFHPGDNNSVFRAQCA